MLKPYSIRLYTILTLTQYMYIPNAKTRGAERSRLAARVGPSLMATRYAKWRNIYLFIFVLFCVGTCDAQPAPW